ncbi:conserved hypothetical protein [Vibrio chagasii]|nr:conserved hypothetical protein [Vibrio chagasii]CAH6896457.1 conserved hypothetical protein [Vibrio chagasii]
MLPSITRYDCFLIWPHGLGELTNILEYIESTKGFKIKLVKRKTVNNFNKFIREVYSFDYAPWQHLKSKTKYLRSVGNEVCFIFVENLNPQEDFVDFGEFRHIECDNVKNVKNHIRKRYNPRDGSGEMTHDHIIHATDNFAQTIEMLSIAGFPIKSLKENCILNTPWFLGDINKFIVKNVAVEDLKCRVLLEGESEIKSVKESPQYTCLEDGIISQEYKQYLDQNMGRGLLSYYSIKKYCNLRKSFSYLSGDYKNDYIIVTKHERGYIVLDGLHRLSILIKDHSPKSILVCVI